MPGVYDVRVEGDIVIKKLIKKGKHPVIQKIQKLLTRSGPNTQPNARTMSL